jgi:hypothetical protein
MKAAAQMELFPEATEDANDQITTQIHYYTLN